MLYDCHEMTTPCQPRVPIHTASGQSGRYSRVLSVPKEWLVCCSAASLLDSSASASLGATTLPPRASHALFVVLMVSPRARYVPEPSGRIWPGRAHLTVLIAVLARATRRCSQSPRPFVWSPKGIPGLKASARSKTATVHSPALDMCCVSHLGRSKQRCLKILRPIPRIQGES